MLRRLRSRYSGIVLGGLLLLGVAVIGVALQRWLVVSIGALAVLGLLLAVSLHGHKRISDTGTNVRSQAKLALRIDSRLSATQEQLDALHQDRADALDLVERRLEVLSGQLLARVDLLERDLSEVARDLVSVSDELASHSRSLTGGQDQSPARSGTQAGEEIREELGRANDRLHRLPHELLSEIDALVQLHERSGLTGPAPLLAGWALSPRALLQVVDLARARDGCTVLECGSGTSTVYLAAALAHQPASKVIALEHLSEEAHRVQEYLDDNGLSHIAEVRHTALTPQDMGGESYLWYDLDAVRDHEGIDLLLVDGPPKGTGDLARYPALPLLAPRLATDAIIVMDDANRSEERRILERWRSEHSLTSLASITPEQAVLRWTGATSVDLE